MSELGSNQEEKNFRKPVLIISTAVLQGLNVEDKKLFNWL